MGHSSIQRESRHSVYWQTDIQVTLLSIEYSTSATAEPNSIQNEILEGGEERVQYP